MSRSTATGELTVSGQAVLMRIAYSGEYQADAPVRVLLRETQVHRPRHQAMTVLPWWV